MITGTLTVDATVIAGTLTISNGTPGVGVPVGGTTAQALVKASDADYDTVWATPAGGGDALVANPLSQFAATTKAQLNGVISDGTPMYVGDAPTAHTHVASEITDFDAEVSNNAAVAANTAKVSNVDHPLVETAVPVGAVFTDTVYNDAAIQAEVDLNTAKVGVTTELKPTDIDTLAELNAIVTDATLIDTSDARLSDARAPTAHTHVASEITDFDAEVSNNAAVAANTAKVGNVDHPLVETAVPVGAVFTDTVYNDAAIQAEVDLNTAKVGVTTELKPTDIDTLAELNAIVTDATLIDTSDARLSDARAPTAHTHVASEITDFDAEVSNNAAVAANTAKVGVTVEEQNPDLISQAEAEAGTATTERTFSALRVAQAIAALGGGGGGGGGPEFLFLSSDFVINNDATFNVIPALTVNIPANTAVSIQYHLLYTSSSSADGTIEIDKSLASASPTYFYFSLDLDSTSAAASTDGGSFNLIGVGSFNRRSVTIICSAAAGVSPVEMEIRIRQQIAEVSDTTVLAGSYAIITQ